MNKDDLELKATSRVRDEQTDKIAMRIAENVARKLKQRLEDKILPLFEKLLKKNDLKNMKENC